MTTKNDKKPKSRLITTTLTFLQLFGILILISFVAILTSFAATWLITSMLRHLHVPIHYIATVSVFAINFIICWIFYFIHLSNN